MDQAAFVNHAVWANLRELEALIASAQERNEAAAVAPLGDLRYLSAALGAHADPADVAPYTLTALNNVQASLANVLGETRNYVNNGNVAHLTNAQTHADATAFQVSLLPTAALKGGAAAQANKLFGEYRASVQTALASLQATNEALRTQIQQQQTASDSALTLLREQVEQLSTRVAQDAARLDTALVTNNEAFTAKQTEREERFTAWLEQQGSSLRELAATDLSALHSFKANGENAFVEIDKLRDDTKTVAGLAAGDQVGRGYKGYSFRQWVAGLASYAVGFSAITAGALVVVLTIKSIKPADTITWQFALLKLGLTASVVFAAVIAFRLGSHLLAEAGTAKRFELELKALGPLFPHDDESTTLQDVKKSLVERSFGHAWESREQGKDLLNEQLIERIAEAVARSVVRPPGT